MTRTLASLVALAMAASACSPPASEMQTEGAVPADLAALALAASPGLTITGGDLNASGDQYEVTGTLPNGDEVELDLVQSNGAWMVIEIQRDIPWSSVPEPVRAMAGTVPNPFEPVRVIESTQSEDGSIVYELFRPVPGGSPSGGPDVEVRWHEGNAEVIP